MNTRANLAWGSVSAGFLALAIHWDTPWPTYFGLIPVYLVSRRSHPWRAALAWWTMAFITITLATTWTVPTLDRFAGLATAPAFLIQILLGTCGAFAYAIVGLLAAFLFQRFRLSWLLTAPLLLVLAESFLPFPFTSSLALTVWRVRSLTQIAEIGGAPAVSAVVLLLNLVLAEAAYQLYRQRALSRPVMVAALVFGAVFLLSSWRIHQLENAGRLATKLRVGMVQPNFGILSPKDRQKSGRHIIDTLRKATEQLASQGAELVVWPESSWPFLFDRQIKHEFPGGHPWALRGAFRGRLLFGTLSHSFGRHKVFNSAVLIDNSGRIAGRHDKNLLVPFAEYIPLAKRFPQLAVSLRSRFPEWPEITAGQPVNILVDQNLRIGPFICSEELDASHGRTIARQNPNLLVSIANDIWFGEGAAPRQHMALAAFRAIETRRDLVRVTNNGHSAIIDATGRIVQESPLVVAEVPVPATLLLGEVVLLEVPAASPSIRVAFPFLCLVILIVATGLASRSTQAQPASPR